MGCSEANRASVVGSPVPSVEAALVVSDSSPAVGATLLVSVQATSKQGIVGSFTARITYDSTALRYEGEAQSNDKAMRATNPAPGLLRFAGAAVTGFTNGELASYTFVVLKPDATRTLSLGVDEMHMVSRFDARTALTVLPTRTISR